MLDPDLLRNDLDLVVSKLVRRGFIVDADLLRSKEARRKILQIKKEALQADRNSRSKLIGAVKERGENIETLRSEVKKLGKKLDVVKTNLNNLEREIHDYTLTLPNLPDDSVPNGKDHHQNREISRWGKPKRYDFPVRDHIALGAIAGGLDFSAAVKITGSGFVVMTGTIARMHRALSQFMLDLHTEQHGYLEAHVPYIVNHTTLYSTGQLPKFGKDLFHIQLFEKTFEGSHYALIPTAEVPLINLMRTEILEERSLPLRMTAHTPCFRAEAGSYGKDTRGLIRMHQFDKVEIVQIVRPEDSMVALETLTSHAEKVLQLLHLPYRKVLLCNGDMGFGACKTYDLEVWLPAQNRYREISSCSNMSDFQARRLKTRYRRRSEKKSRLVHTLNGSGLAVGRTLAAVLENYQEADSRIRVPEVLRPYMQGVEFIG